MASWIARRTARVALLALAGISLASCSEPPKDCDPAAFAAIDELARESANELAPRSVEVAKAEVASARAHIDEQRARLKPFRSWDGERCGKAVAAIAKARGDVASAKSSREAALQIEQAAHRKLEGATQALAMLAAFLDGGVLGPDVAERIARERGIVESVKGKLALAVGDLRSGGFLGSTKAIEQVTAEVDGAARALAALSAEAEGQAVARCRPKLGAHIPSFSGAPRVLGDWLMWRGEAGGRSALFVFRLDRERRSCRQLAASAERAELPLSIDDVRVWRAAGRVPAHLLTGWSERGAWFVPQGGGMFAFTHESAARFVQACRGRVRCEAPEVGATTMEATCACAYEDLDIAIADRNRRVRYVWDGRLVRAEL